MSFKQKLVVAFGAASLLLICVGVLTFRRMQQDDKDQQWVSHTHIVTEELELLRADLLDAEANQLGYTVTGANAYLDRYRSTGSRVYEDDQVLRNLTADNPRQQLALAEIEPLIKAELAELDNLIRRRESDRLDTATMAQMETGRQDMDRLRALIAKMNAEEQRLLSQRVKTARASAQNIKRVVILGNVLAFGFLLSAGLVIQGEMVKRKQSEDRLRQSEERFRLLVSSVKDYAILMLDPDGRIVSWNDGAERIKGYHSDEILGQHFSVFYPAEDRERGKPASELKVTTEQGRLEDEGWRIRKDGSRFWANVVFTALRDGTGQLRGFAKVSRDVTERKQNEERMRIQNAQLEAANKELEAFCYSVSHDLRAPLRGIDGFSQALLEDNFNQLDSQGKEYLQRVRNSAQRMAALIDDLLSLSRLTRSEMRREPVDLSSMADSIAIDLGNREPERSVAFVVAPDLRAKADPRLLRIVLENLLGNSWKFTSKREHARIEVGSIQDNGHPMYFVRDNGVGFDPKYSSKLFGAFQRLHGVAEFPGSGIGLATVQRIICRHGGRIWADAELNCGATFYFTL